MKNFFIPFFIFIFCLLVTFYSFSGELKIAEMGFQFSILGINTGEAKIEIYDTKDSFKVESTLFSYPLANVFMTLDDKVISFVDKTNLFTYYTKRYLRESKVIDTNEIFFQRDKKIIKVESIYFGSTNILDEENKISDLPGEFLRIGFMKQIPSNFSIHFVDVTNVHNLYFEETERWFFVVTNVKGGYVVVTNIGGLNILKEANIPVIYIPPFGNISVKVQLKYFKKF